MVGVVVAVRRRKVCLARPKFCTSSGVSLRKKASRELLMLAQSVVVNSAEFNDSLCGHITCLLYTVDLQNIQNYSYADKNLQGYANCSFPRKFSRPIGTMFYRASFPMG